MLVTIIGPGVLAGIIAIALRSIGFCAKLLYEAVEEIDEGQVEAVRSTGASGAQVTSYGIVPQILPAFAGISVFRWDINIRESTVLGLVGAGGIGLELNAAITQLTDPGFPDFTGHYRRGDCKRVGLGQGPPRDHLKWIRPPVATRHSLSRSGAAISSIFHRHLRAERLQGKRSRASEFRSRGHSDRCRRSPRFGFQSFQELPEADEIKIAVHTRHVAIIFCYRRAKSSFSLETRSTLRIAQQSHALGRLSIVAWELTGRGLLDPCAAGPRDSVLSPILIHDDATGRIEARPVVHQTMKDRVSVSEWPTSRPGTHRPCRPAARPWSRLLQRNSKMPWRERLLLERMFEWRQCIQVKPSRQPSVWHAQVRSFFALAP